MLCGAAADGSATPLTVPPPAAGDDLAALLLAEVETARAFICERHAPATRRAYASDFRIFEAWCTARGAPVLPAAPEVVAVFLATEATAGRSVATVERRAAAITFAHRAAGLVPPTAAEGVRSTLAGIRRTLRSAPSQKKAATPDVLRAMVDVLPSTIWGLRDRAVLLFGFAGAFRRSELAALTIGDLDEVDQGLRVRIHRSKTNQEGELELVPVLCSAGALCPVAAVRAWREAAGIDNGSLFRRIAKGGRVLVAALSAGGLGQIVKEAAGRAGFDSGEFGGHSLRAGFVTAAVQAGRDPVRIAAITRHRSLETLRGYVRIEGAFRNHPGEGLLP